MIYDLFFATNAMKFEHNYQLLQYICKRSFSKKFWLLFLNSEQPKTVNHNILDRPWGVLWFGQRTIGKLEMVIITLLSKSALNLEIGHDLLSLNKSKVVKSKKFQFQTKNQRHLVCFLTPFIIFNSFLVLTKTWICFTMFDLVT